MRKAAEIVAVACVLAAAGWVFAQEQKPAGAASPEQAAKRPDQPAKGEEECVGSPQAKHAGFDRLKSLAGEWVVSRGDGDKPDGEADSKEAVIVYRVIAAGTAVEEQMFPGTPHEMVTMYHLDGPELLLTHYCAAGNQPRMRAQAGGGPDQIVFKFAGGTNLDPAKDGHMHDLTITFLEADHIRQEWTFWQDGKAGPGERFELKRRK